MNIEYHKHYSSYLQRDMEFKVYGHAGKPVIFIPCQGGRFFDFENFGMIDYWAKWIDEGRVTVYSVDVVDNETYAADGDPRGRIEWHEHWYNYMIEELVPTVKHLSGLKNGYDQPIMTFGCSMGAMHAANLFFRRPDIFDTVFAISGLYDSKLFFGDYMDDILYRNSPVNYLSDMPADHPYIQMYNERKILIVVGQGAWEEPLLASTRWLDDVMRRKGINGRVEYWGYDVAHDWCWWYKMVETYLPELL